MSFGKAALEHYFRFKHLKRSKNTLKPIISF